MSNKIKYGLKNVHYAVITVTNGVPSYATPVAIPGAVNLSMDPSGEKVEFYADDTAYFVTNTNTGYEGDLEMALIPDAFATDVMGETVDANGAQIENANAIPKDFALMFEFQGDANATRHILYNVNAARPSVQGSSKNKTIEAKTETLKITASPAVDTGDVKAKLKPTDTGYSTFFSSVYLESAVTNTVSPSSSTFSKASPADVTINVTSSSGTNAVKDVKFNGASIGGANLTISGVDATIESSYLATLTNAVYTVTVEFTQGNAVTYTLTVAA